MSKKMKNEASIYFNPADCSIPKMYGPPKKRPENKVRKIRKSFLDRQQVPILNDPPKDKPKESEKKKNNEEL